MNEGEFVTKKIEHKKTSAELLRESLALGDEVIALQHQAIEMHAAHPDDAKVDEHIETVLNPQIAEKHRLAGELYKEYLRVEAEEVEGYEQDEWVHKKADEKFKKN